MALLDSLVTVLRDAEGVLDPLFRWMYIVLLPDYNMPPSYIQGISCPIPVVQSNVQLQAGVNIHYPVRRTLSTDMIGIQLYEDQALPTLNWFMQWQEKVIGGTVSNNAMQRNIFQPPVYYKRDIQVYAIDSEASPVCSFNYRGCYPAAINGYDFDVHGWSSYLAPSVQLYVDTMDITWISTPNFITPGLTLNTLTNLNMLPGMLANAGRNIFTGAISNVASFINPTGAISGANMINSGLTSAAQSAASAIGSIL